MSHSRVTSDEFNGKKDHQGNRKMERDAMNAIEMENMKPLHAQQMRTTCKHCVVRCHNFNLYGYVDDVQKVSLSLQSFIF